MEGANQIALLLEEKMSTRRGKGFAKKAQGHLVVHVPQSPSRPVCTSIRAGVTWLGAGSRSLSPPMAQDLGHVAILAAGQVHMAALGDHPKARVILPPGGMADDPCQREREGRRAAT